MIYSFEQEPESGLIIISVEIDDKYDLKMVLDTGATNTTIGSNALYLLGYDLRDNIGTVEIETANGIIDTEVFEVHSFSSLGVSKQDFQIQVYDFLAHGIFSDYNGLLGLDFLAGSLELFWADVQAEEYIFHHQHQAEKVACNAAAGHFVLTKFLYLNTTF